MSRIISGVFLGILEARPVVLPGDVLTTDIRPAGDQPNKGQGRSYVEKVSREAQRAFGPSQDDAGWPGVTAFAPPFKVGGTDTPADLLSPKGSPSV